MNAQDYFLLKAMTGWQGVKLVDTPIPEAPTDALTSLEEVLRHLDGIQTVTLDVFDTLLRRDVEPPDYPKQSAMQHLSLLLAQIGINISIEELLELRDKAEALSRQNALAWAATQNAHCPKFSACCTVSLKSVFTIKSNPCSPIRNSRTMRPSWNANVSAPCRARRNYSKH